MTLLHAYSQTVADGTATSVVRPSDWNSGHNQFVTISGNTAGQSTISGTNVVYQGGNNVTLSAITAAGAATIVFSGANTAAQTVQTQASGAIAGTGFSSTSTAGVALTAALGTNGLTMAIPAFITTYVNDLTSGRAGAGYTSTTQAGSTVGATQNTAGLSVAWPPFITTAPAAQTVQTQASGAIAGTGFTSTSTAGVLVTAALGTNGLNMAVPSFITTYVNDLTSGRAGTGFSSTSTAGVAITAALGTNGLSMAVPNYITTYVAQTTQTQAAGSIAGIGYTSTTQAGSTVGLTQGTNGLSAAWPPFITTAAAAQTTQTQAAGAIAGTGFTSASTAGVAITAALGTNGLNMAVPAFITTYVNDLTSGRAGTGFTSASTAGVAITAALGTNGLSMAVPAYITTYVAQTTQTQAAGSIAGIGYTSTTQAGSTVGLTQSTNGLSAAWPPFLTTYAAQTVDTNKAGTGTTFGGTNISGSMTLNTNGLALSLSAGAAGGGANLSYLDIANNGNSFTSPPTQNNLYLQYFEAPNVSFCRIDQLVSANILGTSSYTAPLTTAQTTTLVTSNAWAVTKTLGIYSRGTGTNSTRIELMPGSTTVSMGYAEAYSIGISASITTGSILNTSIGTYGVTNGVSIFGPVNIGTNGGMTYTTIPFTSTASKAFSSAGVVATASTSCTTTIGNGATAVFTGMKAFAAGMGTSLPQNNYWLGAIYSTGNTSSGFNPGAIGGMSLLLYSNRNESFVNVTYGAGNATTGYIPYQGTYTAATGALPSLIASNAVSGNNNAPNGAVFPHMLLNQQLN